ncbi:hypothetical protein ACFVUH_35060 [Kitasatospora sp. NPDC058032]|uniref:hypothetical protein n=1 Tax=Kitasatospora sp. NPDC058032 TaxID=3346307 RepID=UPI0036D83AF4
MTGTAKIGRLYRRSFPVRFTTVTLAYLLAIVALAWLLSSRDRHFPWFPPGLLYVAAILGYPVLLLVPWQWTQAVCREHRTGPLARAGLVALLLGGGAFAALSLGRAEQQALHERGTAVAAVVVRHEEDPGDPELGASASYRYVVRLPGGEEESFSADKDELPLTEQPVTVTIDPLGKVDSIAGTPPSAPATAPWAASFALAFAGALAVAAATRFRPTNAATSTSAPSRPRPSSSGSAHDRPDKS